MKSRRDILRSSRHKKFLEKRRTYFLWGGGVLALLGVLVGVLAWLSGNPRAVIADIEIRGNSAVASETIAGMAREQVAGKYLWLFHKDNIFLYPREHIRKSILSQHKRISDLDMYLDDSAVLVINITERKSAYLWCGDAYPEEEREKRCFFMDPAGYIFSPAPYFSGNVYFEWYGPTQEHSGDPVGERFLPLAEFKKLVSLKEALAALDLETTHLESRADGDFALALKDSGDILFNIDQEFGALLDNLDSVTGELVSFEDLEYIDLRFGNKIFYRYK